MSAKCQMKEDAKNWRKSKVEEERKLKKEMKEDAENWRKSKKIKNQKKWKKVTNDKVVKHITFKYNKSNPEKLRSYDMIREDENCFYGYELEDGKRVFKVFLKKFCEIEENVCTEMQAPQTQSQTQELWEFYYTKSNPNKLRRFLLLNQNEEYCQGYELEKVGSGYKRQFKTFIKKYILFVTEPDSVSKQLVNDDESNDVKETVNECKEMVNECQNGETKMEIFSKKVANNEVSSKNVWKNFHGSFNKHCCLMEKDGDVYLYLNIVKDDETFLQIKLTEEFKFINRKEYEKKIIETLNQVFN